MIDQTFVTQNYANEKPFQITTIDDNYNFSSPIKINPDKVKAYREEYLSRLESENCPDLLGDDNPPPEEQEKLDKMMKFMDNAIEKKKARKL